LKWVNMVCMFFFGACSCYLLLKIGEPNLSQLGLIDAVAKLVSGKPLQEEPSISIPTYLSFVSVMLTAVTVVLAALAIGIGLVAAFTFKEIKDEAKAFARLATEDAVTAAEKSIAKAIETELSPNAIQSRIDKIAFATKSTDAMDELEEETDLNLPRT
jgi:hypothetical protein